MAGYMTIIHSVWVVPSFGLLQIKLLWTPAYIYLCRRMFILSKYLGVKWLDGMADACLLSKETTKLFYKVVVSFYIPTSCIWVFSSSTSLPTLGVFIFLILAISVSVQWYIIEVLICIPLMVSSVKYFSYAYLPSV